MRRIYAPLVSALVIFIVAFATNPVQATTPETCTLGSGTPTTGSIALSASRMWYTKTTGGYELFVNDGPLDPAYGQYYGVVTKVATCTTASASIMDSLVADGTPSYYEFAMQLAPGAAVPAQTADVVEAQVSPGVAYSFPVLVGPIPGLSSVTVARFVLDVGPLTPNCGTISGFTSNYLLPAFENGYGGKTTVGYIIGLMDKTLVWTGPFVGFSC